MDRRDFLKTASAGAIAAGLGPTTAESNTRPPNIVIIMADDLGYGDLGCYGSQAIKTPNLDSMASDGVRMTDFYSSAPVCSPSRAGLLTGRYPVRAGVPKVFHPVRNPAISLPIHMLYRIGPGMPLREKTLAEYVKPEGYSTCCIGKWHLGDLEPYKPYRRGFDHFFGVLYSNDMIPFSLFRNKDVVDRSPADQTQLTRRYTEEAVSWIEDHQTDPFLLYMPHTFPHIPLHAGSDIKDTSEAGLYGDVVEEVDWSVGEVLKTLDRLNLSDTTFVFFTSDNGPWYQGSTGVNRGRKGQTFDGGMRVPGIARWPGVIPAGVTSNQPAMNFDLFSTSLQIAGADLPTDRTIDGLDILPTLKGIAETPHEELFFFNGHTLQCVRTGKWKYHRKHPGYNAAYSVVPKGPFLFDLEKDPDESYDVSGLFPDVVRDLEAKCKSFQRDVRKN
jgi:arylsulfatase A-like enzyme